MRKAWILGIAAACLLLAVISPAAYATETGDDTNVASVLAASGTCGEGLTWSFSGSTLTISGSGAMDAGSPWAAYQDKIKALIFTGGVTTVAEEAFRDYDSLTSIDFGSAMVEIDTRAFQDCDGLTSISLPATFRRFGQSCFQDCSNLTQVVCAGSMPSFNGNCLWNGGYITVYYPVSNPWPQQYVDELVTNFGGRLEVLAGNGSSSRTETVQAQGTTAPATEPTAEATVPPETQPATQPATEPAAVTAPATQPEETSVATAEPTVQTTAATETTEPEEETDRQTGENGWIGLVIIAVVLTLIAGGMLIFRGVSHKGGKYTD